MSLLIYSFPKQSFDFLDVINQKEYYRESYFIYHDPDLILQRCGIISTPIKSMTKPNTKLIVRLCLDKDLPFNEVNAIIKTSSNLKDFTFFQILLGKNSLEIFEHFICLSCKCS